MRLALACLLAALASAPAHADCPPDARIDALAAAWESRTPAAGYGPALTLEDAECARDRLVERLMRTQGRIVGYKAGLTNPAVQARFGHPAPIRGVLLERMLLADGAEVPAAYGARPVYEADLLVEVKDEGINTARTPQEVLEHVAAVIPFIELADLVLAPEVAPSGPALVAINAGARLGVLGARLPVDDAARLAGQLGAMEVVLTDADGSERARGPGTAILGHPLNAVIWLAQDLARHGDRLRTGDLLSLGSFTPLTPPSPGRGVRVRYVGLPGEPAVSVNFR
ncbi:2-keto-4-pentenoate hydratase [Plasticicumulans lactativorans]|uniref:2-keto-4-pentenoate hydratase n=1 Tax=Plasticicumulans lactativorans TaxID=1133106 RepID=A0A4R2LAQ3_9GAMM|nr:hypothetical protein [Plasticicumulans lactativorans]TCO81409.1 2-keto-4-pentenoate hydratase [Plasticicumulans lactativorans]